MRATPPIRTSAASAVETVGTRRHLGAVPLFLYTWPRSFTILHFSSLLFFLTVNGFGDSCYTSRAVLFQAHYNGAALYPLLADALNPAACPLDRFYFHIAHIAGDETDALDLASLQPM